MKACVLVSGGVDSTTCLALAVAEYGAENIVALSMFYGQKHNKELQCAKNICEYYHVEHIQMDLSALFQYSDCSLLEHSQQEIPKSSYQAQLEHTSGSPVSTYVPFRNGLFLSCAASIALSKDCQFLFYGAHKDDAAGNAYPDCSSTFTNAMNQAIYEGSGKQLQVKAPFLDCAKKDVVAKGLSLNVPYELTWSCYEGGKQPCGTCATCIDRRLAFEANHTTDPLLL